MTMSGQRVFSFYVYRWTCSWHTHLYMWETSWNVFSDKLWSEHDRIILQHITKSCSDCPSITIKSQHKHSLCVSLTVSWHCHLIKQIAWWGIHSYTAAELNDWSMITVHKIRSMAPVVVLILIWTLIISKSNTFSFRIQE